MIAIVISIISMKEYALWASWLFPVLAVGASMVVLTKVVEALWWRPRRVERHFWGQGIKGPTYRFFLGNAREMVGYMFKAASEPMMPPNSHNILPRVLSFYHHWSKAYGPTFLMWFGPMARLTVADPDLIREIFVSRAQCFERYEAHPIVRQLEGEGLVSLRGEKWAHHRKVVAPAFHTDNLTLLAPQIGEKVVEMVERWCWWWWSSSDGEVEMDVYEWFHSMNEEAITRAVFGRSYEEGKAVLQLQSQLMLFASEAFYRVLIPGYRYLPTRKNAYSWRLDKKIRSSLAGLISRRSKEDKPEGGGAKDLIGLMIDESKKRSSGPRSAAVGPPRISVLDIMEECKTFFFAGKQTTSGLLTWTTVLLAMHPEWQDLARQEVISVCGRRGIPSRDHLAKLKTMGMILRETLRLYPPAVATIRSAKCDVELGGCKIPRGTELLIPILAVHHDASLWGPDASHFNPARFAEGPSRAARHPNAYMPFGLGARRCIGQNLALMEAKITMAIILQRFSFRLAATYVHAPTVLMLLYPQYGAPVLFRPLSASARLNASSPL